MDIKMAQECAIAFSRRDDIGDGQEYTPAMIEYIGKGWRYVGMWGNGIFLRGPLWPDNPAAGDQIGAFCWNGSAAFAAITNFREPELIGGRRYSSPR